MDYPLEKLLQQRYALPEWVLLFELSGGTGWSAQQHRADAVAFNCYPSKGLHRLAFEVKRTRHDYMREVDSPAKRQWLERLCHQCYFVVAPGIVKEEEIPSSWGLIVVTKEGKELRRVKAAEHRDLGPLPEPFALGAIRALADRLHTIDSKHYRFKDEEVTQEQIDAVVGSHLEFTRKRLEDELRDLRKLEHGLNDERRVLRGPLEALAYAVESSHRLGRHRVVGSFGMREGDLPTLRTEDVHQWMAEVRTQGLTRLRTELSQVSDRLSNLLANIDVEEQRVRSEAASHPPVGCRK
jgi:hypothetical protein